ncbi:RcpC/CpaB family pilus assembly protein [Streptomyces sp. NPDC047071]|uniref:RcpC/CpaB family pilus assembly protein n=1 Tax=Streptomyces sp. NPDC047071 TaxID=3154808 RepID=UPI0034515858
MTQDASHIGTRTGTWSGARTVAYGSGARPGPEARPGSGPGGGGGGGAPPPPCQVPHFSPVHVRGGRQRLRRLARHRRRAVAVGLAMTAAALAAAGPRDAGSGRPGGSAASVTAEGTDRGPEPVRRAARPVTAPIRIADAATARLLRPGDRVDVVAAEDPATGRGAAPRVIAANARVAEVPEVPETADGTAGAGALVVLSVPGATAARLAGASATARLAVTLR